MSVDKHTKQDDQQHDDLEVTDENAGEVKGGGWHVGVNKKPEDGFRGAPKKGPDSYHVG